CDAPPTEERGAMALQQGRGGPKQFLRSKPRLCRERFFALLSKNDGGGTLFADGQEIAAQPRLDLPRLGTGNRVLGINRRIGRRRKYLFEILSDGRGFGQGQPALLQSGHA